MEKKATLSFTELVLRKQKERDQKETITEFLIDDEEDKMKETNTELSKYPKEKPKEKEEIVTTKVRSKTWDKEKMRTFQTIPIQEQLQVMEEKNDT